ncbi:MAG TPA: rhomboid family intramembrane serine protease [Thermopetrobacter sp.]|nr:rhomboid family intramembrane serine protease [Thermopetrobacter sp.]
MFPISTTVANRYPPFATWALIGLNVLAYLWEMSFFAAGGEPALRAFLIEWGLVPARYFVPGWAEMHGLSQAWLPFLSNTFLHGGLLHLVFNMWTLYIFGPAVEDRMGTTAYVLFYLLCGVGASFAHAWMNPSSTLPAIGASGAIAGVIGAYMRLFPRSNVVVLVPIFFYPLFFELPAVVFATFWFVTQLLQGVASLTGRPDAGGVAWWAHVGGFVVGWLAASIWGPDGRHPRPLQADEGAFGCCPDGRRRRGPWDGAG